jgi:hypothetical protein
MDTSTEPEQPRKTFVLEKARMQCARGVLRVVAPAVYRLCAHVVLTLRCACACLPACV